MATNANQPRHRSVVAHPVFAALCGFAALMIYLWIAFVVLPPQAFWSPDEGAKFLQLKNLRLEQGHLHYTIAYPGQTVDPNLQYAQSGNALQLLHLSNATLYFQRLPLFPLLVLPLFQLFGFYGLYLIPAVCGAVIGTLSLSLVRAEHRQFRAWLLIAFASPVFIYSVIFWEHTLASMLALGAACLLLTFEHTERAARLSLLGGVAVGILMGLAVYIRQEVVIFAIALLAGYWLVVVDKRRIVVWSGATLGITLLAYVPLHRAMFSQAVPDNALYLFYPFSYLRDSGWRAIPDLLLGPAEELALPLGWAGYLWTGAAVAALFFSSALPNRRVIEWLWLLLVAITAVAGAILLFDPLFYRSAHGLLFSTPWALLALCRVRTLWHYGERRIRVIAMTTVLGLIGYCIGIVGFRAGSPQGGLEWGARFALTFYPLLAIMAVWNRGLQANRKLMALASLLLLLGFGFQIRGIFTLYHDKHVNAILNRVLVERPALPVVSDLWWMPFNTAPLYPETSVFVVDDQVELQALVQAAASKGVKQCYLVTANERLLEDAPALGGRYRTQIDEIQRIEKLLVVRVTLQSSYR